MLNSQVQWMRTPQQAAEADIPAAYHSVGKSKAGLLAGKRLLLLDAFGFFSAGVAVLSKAGCRRTKEHVGLTQTADTRPAASTATSFTSVAVDKSLPARGFLLSKTFELMTRVCPSANQSGTGVTRSHADSVYKLFKIGSHSCIITA
eukprot:2713751-Amphidinium_carterae.1